MHSFTNIPILALSQQICLIPDSAHGTNAASAQMAGLQVVKISTHKDGGVNLEEFKKKVVNLNVDLQFSETSLEN